MKLSVFIRRITHCRGFGIQSPTDFAFVNDVIYERLPYHAYDELDSDFPDLDRHTRSLAKLLLRVSNYAQPGLYRLAPSTPPAFAAYLQRGCTGAKTDRTFYFDQLPDALHDGDCIIITDIYGQGRGLWQSLLSIPDSHLVAFDLYYLGIAFHRAKRYPETHIVNFY